MMANKRLFDLDRVVIYQVAAGNTSLQLTDKQYAALFEHYVKSNQIPHNVLRAREKDPVLWISDRIVHEHKLGTLPNTLAQI